MGKGGSMKPKRTVEGGPFATERALAKSEQGNALAFARTFRVGVYMT